LPVRSLADRPTCAAAIAAAQVLAARERQLTDQIFSCDRVLTCQLTTIEGTDMKSRIYKLVLPLAAGLLALDGTAFAQVADPAVCNNRILSGDYAFTLGGTIYMPNGAGGTTLVLREGIAMTHFNGQGNLTQIDYALGNGVAQGPVDQFRTDETGSYTVNPDCTGTAEIDFPPAPGATAGAVIKLIFVLARHGEAIHTVVAELIPPGASQPIPASIHSEGTKL
jgi:hypothetical protein